MKWFKTQTAKFYIKDLLIFMLGAYGIGFFSLLQDLINSCNKNVFGMICMVISFVLIVQVDKKIHA